MESGLPKTIGGEKIPYDRFSRSKLLEFALDTHDNIRQIRAYMARTKGMGDPLLETIQREMMQRAIKEFRDLYRENRAMFERFDQDRPAEMLRALREIDEEEPV